MGEGKRVENQNEGVETIKHNAEFRNPSRQQVAKKTNPKPAGSRPMNTDEEPLLVQEIDLPPESITDQERYIRRSLLAEGGMGRIHVTTDQRIGRDVAMKVLRRRYGSQSDTLARFLREARIQGQLEHPSIVPVYDLGRLPNGDIFFTMKRIRGKSLEEIIDGQIARGREFIERYPRRTLLRAFSHTCLAVDFAHKGGVLHRDLKPANIMLGDYGEVYILDWGLSKVIGMEDESPPSRPSVSVPPDGGTETIDGAVLGTPGYMSPEQARGETARMDARSDVYSLGVILYEMLALQPMHSRGRVSAIMVSTIRGIDGRPSFRAPQRGIPPELDAICVKATQLNPEHRFNSARELHDAIVRFLDGEQDMELLREMSGAHARAAEVAAQYAFAGGPTAHDERIRALREVGRALALDPTHPEARRVLVRLLAEPPQDLPEAEKEQEHHQDQDRRIQAIRTNGWLQIGLLLSSIPFMIIMGIRSWFTLIFFISTGVIAIGNSFLVARRNFPRRIGTLSTIITGATFIGTISTMFGPFLLIPGLAAVNAMVHTIHISKRTTQTIVILLCSSSIFVPLWLEAVGILPPSYQFQDGVMHVLPRMHELPLEVTIVFLCFISFANIVAISIVVGRFRESLQKAEQKQRMTTWQFEQLVTDTTSNRNNMPS